MTSAISVQCLSYVNRSQNEHKIGVYSRSPLLRAPTGHGNLRDRRDENNSTRARLGWTISYIYCIFVQHDLDSVPLFVGMQERSIAFLNNINHGKMST